MTDGCDPVQVREAGSADAAGLAFVHVLSWRQAYAGLLPASFLEAWTVTAGSWRERLASGPGDLRTWVALREDRVIGFASAGAAQPDLDDGTGPGQLFALYVLAEGWGQGIGARLHAVALQHLRAAGFGSGVLAVLAGNDRAIAFYQRHGWRFTGQVRREERDGVTLQEPVMRHPLTDPGAGPGER